MANDKISSLGIAGMPNGDYEAHTWLSAFADALASAEGRDLWPALGVTEEKCDQITVLVKAFDEAMLVAHNPMSNTKPNIRAKTEARNAAVLAVRDLANLIRKHPELSEVQKWTFGFEPESRKQARMKRRRGPLASIRRSMSRQQALADPD